MKYIKTFEGFSLNESILGFDLSKVKQAIQAVSSEVEKNVIPNMDDSKKSDLIGKASQFVKKSGIKSTDELITKVMNDVEDKEEEVSKIADSEGVTESMINEKLSERAVRFFKRLGTVAGIGISLLGFSSFVSNLPGWIDSTTLTRLHDISNSILGTYAGAWGLLIIGLGVLLALKSQIWGYKN